MLPERGLARSRTRAAELIRAGAVLVNGVVVTKLSLPVQASDVVEVAGAGSDVSRAAGKLRAALDGAGIDVNGVVALDAGASTGGFTQVLLERGAAHVVAVDVGHDQLVPELGADSRVSSVEGFNVKALNAARYREIAPGIELPTVLVADLSFISLRHVLDAFNATLTAGQDSESVRMVLLIKPQFEVGKGNVSRGIVLDQDKALGAVRAVLLHAAELGWWPTLLIVSPVRGTHGNREYLTVLGRNAHPDQTQWESTIDEMILGVR